MDEQFISQTDSIDHIDTAEQNDSVTESKAGNKPQTEQPILRVEHLKKYFPIQTNFFGKPTRYLKAVDDITFDLQRGKTIGVVGESGCGKTTLGRTILKLYESDGGKIYFMDNDITDLKKSQMMKYRTDIQLIFQDPYSSLPPRMTVGAIIAEPVRVHKIVPKEEVYEYVLDIMKKCGLKPSYYDRYPHEFSGGQRQRICIARALAVKPKLVICDEPVSALDVSIQAQIINLLKDLQKTIGLTYVFISHDLSVVKYITDNILVMYLGNAMEMSETEELFDNPLHPYTQALFSAVPAPNPRVKMNRIMLEGDIPSPANPPAGCKFHTRCSKCMKVCKFVIPEYTEVKPEHFVACHLYNPEIMANLEKYDAEYDRLEEEKRIAIELAAQNKRKRKPVPPPEQPDKADLDGVQAPPEQSDYSSVSDTVSEAADAYSKAAESVESQVSEPVPQPQPEAAAQEPAVEENSVDTKAEKQAEVKEQTPEPEKETVAQAEDPVTAPVEQSADDLVEKAEEAEVATPKPTKKTTAKTGGTTKAATASKSTAAKKSTSTKASTAKTGGTTKTATASKSTAAKKSTSTKASTAKTGGTTKAATASKSTAAKKSTSTKTSTAKTGGTTKTATASKSTSTKSASTKSTSTKSTATKKSTTKSNKTTAAKKADTPGEDKS